MVRRWSRSLVVVSTRFSSSRTRTEGVSAESLLRNKAPRKVKASHRASRSSSPARANRSFAASQLMFELLEELRLPVALALELVGLSFFGLVLNRASCFARGSR